MEKNDLLIILHNFDIAPSAYGLKPINQGFINDTYLVFEGDRPSYVLQRINTAVFSNVDGLMNNLGKALDFLEDTDYAKISLVKTQDGMSFFKAPSAGCWRLMTYIDNSTAYDTTSDVELAFEAGRIIGKFHTLLQNADLEAFVDVIPGFHDLKLRETQFLKALGNASDPRKEIAKNAIGFTQKSLPKLKEMERTDSPLRICHNDTKLNNILFSKTDRKALCLIDLDTLMCGHFHYDFGDAVRTIVNTAPEDEKEHHKITFDKDLFESFVSGLSTNASFLTQTELDQLAYGVVLLPFLHGIRALTDFLNGNIYYKVAYENQNLDRALSLYDFTQKAMDNIVFMEKVIERKLSVNS
ncbi:MAG: phosphotransferase enzyme family protein [Flavobacteriaceae bacterium]